VGELERLGGTRRCAPASGPPAARVLPRSQPPPALGTSGEERTGPISTSHATSPHPLAPFHRYEDVTTLLCDPSCSGSGIVTSPDRLYDAALIGAGGAAADDSAKRVAALAKFQAMVVLKAFSFPAATRVSYSTCSLHEEENEGVVASVLKWQVDRITRKRERDAAESGEPVDASPIDESELFELVECLPAWPHRGRPTHGLDEAQAKMVVRTAAEHGTNGFFVAVFERKKPPPPPPPRPLGPPGTARVVVLLELSGLLVLRARRPLKGKPPSLVAGGEALYTRPGAVALCQWLAAHPRVTLGFMTSMRPDAAARAAGAALGGGDAAAAAPEAVYARDASAKRDRASASTLDTLRDLERVWARAGGVAHGAGPERTLAIDSSAKKMKEHPDNVLVVPPFGLDELNAGDDDGLDALRFRLEQLLAEAPDDVREWVRREKALATLDGGAAGAAAAGAAGAAAAAA